MSNITRGAHAPGLTGKPGQRTKITHTHSCQQEVTNYNNYLFYMNFVSSHPWSPGATAGKAAEISNQRTFQAKLPKLTFRGPYWTRPAKLATRGTPDKVIQIGHQAHSQINTYKLATRGHSRQSYQNWPSECNTRSSCQNWPPKGTTDKVTQIGH